MQWAAPIAAANLGFGRAGLRPGGFRGHGDERIEPRILFFDTRQAVFGKLDGREGTLAK